MKPQIGAHVSVAGGLSNAFVNAEKIGAQCVQIFGANPRQWSVSFPSKEAVKKYKKKQKETGIGPVFLHAAYLVNAASPKKDIYTKSIKSLKEHLTIAKMIGAEGLVFHPGSPTNGKKNEGIIRLAAAMDEVLSDVSGHTHLIIENTAGGGNKLGEEPGEIAEIIKKVSSTRVSVCFDTAHAFEGGAVAFSSQKEVREALDRWDESIGLNRIAVVHANDSKTEYSSHHDKHENIGEGHIGIKGFEYLAKDSRLNNVPWILETPGFDGGGPDEKNLARLHSIF